MAASISQDQWDALGKQSFDTRVAALIRRSHPEQAARLEAPQLMAEIRRQAVRAQAYGLKSEHAVATYVYTAWLVGPEFDKRLPGLAQILNEPTLSGGEKAKALSDFTSSVFHTLGGGLATRTPDSSGSPR